MTKELPEIVVMDRGFVHVGYLRLDPDDYLSFIVDHCHTIRRWGTHRGLGQLAEEGPLAETILDTEGDGVRINRMFIYRRIPCSEKGWGKWRS